MSFQNLTSHQLIPKLNSVIKRSSSYSSLLQSYKTLKKLDTGLGKKLRIFILKIQPGLNKGFGVSKAL